jgi:hypothetical protein
VQLDVDQVHLTQVGRVRKAGQSGAMLDRAARMRVTFDSEPDQQLNAVGVGLAQSVGGAAADRGHEAGHDFLLVNGLLQPRAA